MTNPPKGPFAHTPNKRGEWHLLEDHLRGVAKRAREFGDKFGAGDWAELAGWWHDLGKYSAAFQAYLLAHGMPDSEAHLETLPGKVDHSTSGAIYAIQQIGLRGKVLAYLIAGHHAGLPDGSGADGEVGNLEARIQRTDLLNCLRKADIPNEIFCASHPTTRPTRKDPALWIRMLFSCLVDADFLDTEAHFAPAQVALRSAYPSLVSLIPAFEKFMEKKLHDAPPTPINRIRAEILQLCKVKSALPPGLLSLTVPTGGGKTLSGLAFSLYHARAYGKRRIIYVIPYTSILEQTADIFRSIFGDVVIEHHSNLDPDKETAAGRLAAENWDAPIIVTTSVQFFESLFAAKPSRTRKLHNIVGSVVVLDEIQLLPTAFLAPILRVIQELAANYETTFLFSTATQPAFSAREGLGWRFQGLTGCKELIEHPRALHDALNRVQVQIPPDLLTGRTWQDLAQEISNHPRVLAIVNSRRDCRDLHKLMPKGALHLSALMCPQHRSEVIGRIKEALKTNETVRVVSTQLVEAGVDIDFPVVYRALAGPDSIAQAAGRCNREGLLGQQGKVVLFVPPNPAPRGVLRKAQEIGRQMLASGLRDPLAPEVFPVYFEQLYWRVNSLDEKDILKLLQADGNLALQFRAAASQFRLIDEAGQTPVFVQYGEGTDLIERLRKEGPSRDLLRRLQRFTVNVRSSIVDALLASGSLTEIWQGFVVQSDPAIYHGSLGFLEEPCTVEDPRNLVV